MELYYIKAPDTMTLHGQVSHYKWTNNVSPLLSLIEARRLNAFIGGEIVMIDFGRFTSEDLEKMVRYYGSVKSFLDSLGPDENIPGSEQDIKEVTEIITPSDAVDVLKKIKEDNPPVVFNVNDKGEIDVQNDKDIVIVLPKGVLPNDVVLSEERQVIIERTEEETKKAEEDVLRMVTQPRPSFYAQTIIQEPNLPVHEQNITLVITTPITVDNNNNISDLRDVSLDSLIVDQIAATRGIVFPSYNTMKADLSTADKEIEGFDQRSLLGGSTKTQSVRRTWLYLQFIKEPELV